MIETGDYSFLKVKLMEQLNKRFIHIIGVDGCLDVGKSEFSKNLSRDVGGMHIELDHYLKDDETLSYTDRIYYGILKKTIGDHLDEFRIVIVDGVCLLWVLRKVQYKPDIYVYIKRTTPVGRYRDEDYFDETISEEQMILEVVKNQMAYVEQRRIRNLTGSLSAITNKQNLIPKQILFFVVGRKTSAHRNLLEGSTLA